MEQAGCTDAIYSWRLLELLQEHKHPRHATIGVESTIYGNNPRKEAGIDPCGTVWVSPPAVYYSSRKGGWFAENGNNREFLFAIRKGCIPARNILTARFDEDKARWVGGDLTRGWTNLLLDLCKGGHLRPSRALSALIGKDSFQACPQRFQVI